MGEPRPIPPFEAPASVEAARAAHTAVVEAQVSINVIDDASRTPSSNARAEAAAADGGGGEEYSPNYVAKGGAGAAS